MGLRQLIYSSSAVKHFSEVDLSLILLGARKNNRALGVTGLLLHAGGSFLQVLEGEGTSVLTLFERIARDPRHTRVTQLLHTAIDARQFAGWEMGFVSPKHVASELPGYSDYLRQLDDPAAAGTAAARLLAQFRAGTLRASVEH
jgi:hypothetical protein